MSTRANAAGPASSLSRYAVGDGVRVVGGGVIVSVIIRHLGSGPRGSEHRSLGGQHTPASTQCGSGPNHPRRDGIDELFAAKELANPRRHRLFGLIVDRDIPVFRPRKALLQVCLLYTSDAADE